MSGAGELKPVAVKPLEWQTRTWDSDGYLCFAEASPCEFNYEIDRDGHEKKPFRVSRSCDINPFVWAETLEAAHAAAQAHFEACIRSALVSPDRALVDRVERWQPIETCPIGKSIDLWCVYGGEEFAQFEGGASIGQLVSDRHKTEKYGFFGNQSNDGVPRREGPDLKPVAWRHAVPMCPPELIAAAMNVPMTYAEAVDRASRAALTILPEEGDKS